jgi:hypothetical protein
VELLHDIVWSAWPTAVSDAKAYLTNLEHIVAWRIDQGARPQYLTVDDLLAPDVLERFYADRVDPRAVRTGKQAVANTRHWALDTLSDRVVPELQEDGRPSSSGHHQRIMQPIDDATFERWIDIAAHQRSQRLRDEFCSYLILGRGGGAQSADLRFLTGDDILRTLDGAVAADVKGAHPRLMVILHRFEDQLLQIAERASDNLLLGRWPLRKNPVGDMLDSVAGGTGLIRPVCGRLRAAYLAEMMGVQVSMKALFTQTGLRTARSMEDLLPAVPPYTELTAVDRAALRFGRDLGAPR